MRTPLLAPPNRKLCIPSVLAQTLTPLFNQDSPLLDVSAEAFGHLTVSCQACPVPRLLMSWKFCASASMASFMGEKLAYLPSPVI